jgi:hypothetical protein
VQQLRYFDHRQQIERSAIRHLSPSNAILKKSPPCRHQRDKGQIQ